MQKLEKRKDLGHIFVVSVTLSLAAGCWGLGVAAYCLTEGHRTSISEQQGTDSEQLMGYFEDNHLLSSNQGCTAIYASDGEAVLVGNNEDHIYPFTKIWFIPPEEGKYGRAYFVFDDLRGGLRSQIQGGMNDQGLVFDSFAADPVERPLEEGKPVYSGNLILKAVAECATVEEVLKLFDQHSLPGIWTGQLFIGDSTGDSAIIEPSSVIRKTGKYQIVTNFYQSKTPPEEITCWRYKTAKDMLEDADSLSVDLFRDILDAAGARAITQYSNIYDLKQRIIYVYHFSNYENVVTIDVEEELKKGMHYYDLPSLFPVNDPWESWTKRMMRKFNASLAQRGLATDVDANVYDAYVGQYEVPAELGFLPFPPTIISSLSVTRDNDRLYLKVPPEGPLLELFPKSETSFFHIDLSGHDVPELEVTFHKDERGQATQLIAEIEGLGTVTLERALTTETTTSTEETTTTATTAPSPPTAGPIWTQSWFLAIIGVPIVLVAILALWMLRKRS